MGRRVLFGLFIAFNDAEGLGDAASVIAAGFGGDDRFGKAFIGGFIDVVVIVYGIIIAIFQTVAIIHDGHSGNLRESVVSLSADIVNCHGRIGEILFQDVKALGHR